MDYHLEEMSAEIEMQTNKTSAKRLFDKFFTTDVIIESNQIKEVPDVPGCLKIQDCEMYDRIPANFSEVVDFLLEYDEKKFNKSVPMKAYSSKQA